MRQTLVGQEIASTFLQKDSCILLKSEDNYDAMLDDSQEYSDCEVRITAADSNGVSAIHHLISVCRWVLPSTETERYSPPSHEDIKFFQIGLPTPSHLYNAPHVFFLYIA